VLLVKPVSAYEIALVNIPVLVCALTVEQPVKLLAVPQQKEVVVESLPAFTVPFNWAVVLLNPVVATVVAVGVVMYL
jgi:hypothetical protein